MSLWFRRQSNRVSCFYCNSDDLELIPAHSSSSKGKERAEGCAVGSQRDFWCSNCGQTNRRTETGEILSDEPAHHDPELNDDSFRKRATPSRSRLPTTYTSPFCRTCLSNQSLQVHLLASYPSTSSDEDDEPIPLLPEYKASLDTRYPLVCPACAPSVEEAIADKDSKARSAALGWRLRESKRARRMEQLRQSETRSSWRWRALGVVWGVRGAAFWTTHLAGISGCAAAALRPQLVDPLAEAWVPLTALVSFLWAFWDPTWLQARSERSLGRPPEVVGRSTFIAIQVLIYLLRLVLSLVQYFQLLRDPRLVRQAAAASLLVFAIALFASLHTIRLKRPVSIRLSARRPRITPSPPQDPADPLAALSLTSIPITSTPPPSSSSTSLRHRQPRRDPSQPTFGDRPSWSSSGAGVDPPPFPFPPAPSMDVDSDHEYETNENSMDWDPLPPTPTTSLPSRRDESSSWVLAPPRFFAPQEPTGLEGMFERTLKVDDGRGVDGKGSGGGRWWKWW
ncbi:Ima1 N-terminal domain-domain-containing protein [Leucosporidium creatinivorum]|uniref:Ima1 N-terminal domain-domain-containing protein n=1 Tax=Leucosporidium creatinivorum TaxID=106004 RepID=A0A1Y2G2N6_9BASI|nr:Ima1 N-terminal domain-domain-containing protein [Leucosporidium creatinivorum]